MATGRQTRILIVDDSAVIRSLLRHVVGSAPRPGSGCNRRRRCLGARFLAIERPDLVLLDVEMPVMDGLVTLRKLREQGHRMPVIMCSALTQRGAAVTIEALASGAQRLRRQAIRPGQPRGGRTRAGPGTDSEDSRPRRATSAANRLPASAAPSPLALHSRRRPLGPAQRFAPLVVAIGVSTGGPAALECRPARAARRLSASSSRRAAYA